MKSIFSAALLIAAGYAIKLAETAGDKPAKGDHGPKMDLTDAEIDAMHAEADSYCAEHSCPDFSGCSEDDMECHKAAVEDFCEDHTCSEGEHSGPPKKAAKAKKTAPAELAQQPMIPPNMTE